MTVVTGPIDDIGIGDSIRASTPAIYRFEIDAVSLGTTRRGKPPWVKVKVAVLLFGVSALGFVLVLWGLSKDEARQATPVVQDVRRT